MIRQLLARHGGRAVVPSVMALVCGFLVWDAAVTVRVHRAAARGRSAAATLASVKALGADLERLWSADTTLTETGPTRGPTRTSGFDPERAAVEARNYFRDEPEALEVLDRTIGLRRQAVQSARAAFLSRAASLAASAAPVASPPALERDLAEAASWIAQLEARCEFDLSQAMDDAEQGRSALVVSFGVILALIALMAHTERNRRHHRRGARLVEDMLEAYSRRLESMNVQLEQVNLLKTQFLANTSHELLTPLNGVMGSLEVIRSGSCRSVEEERGFLDQAYQAAERLFALIRDLLDLCHLEEGNLALRCRPVDFRGILERELAGHRTTLTARGLVLLVTPPSEGWPRVAGDPERVTQVLRHLLSNAVKFTDQGSLRVTGRIEPGPCRYLRLEVADTGVGIASDKLGQVFDLFAQADGSNTRRFGGTGLGLTLSRHLVQGMGGQIGIESDGPGRGTRAWFTLPLADSESLAGTSPPTPESHRRAA